MAPRKSGTPRRKITNQAARRQIVVFTEGEKTEVQYLTHWHRKHRESVLVRVDDFHGGPLQLVEHAVRYMAADKKAEKRGEGRGSAEVWCMFDIDEHPNVPRALELAAAQSINVVVSNPCLELWYLLHFKDQTAWIDRGAAQHDVGEFITKAKYLTSSDVEALEVRHGDATARAQRLADRHEGNGSARGENPSSDVWRLVESISHARP